MRFSHVLFLILLLSSSCVEELEPLDPSSEKLYGYNGNSSAYGIIQNSDNTYLIYGSASRTVMGHSVEPFPAYDSEMPVLIKLDQRGNEVMSRVYPLNNLEYQIEVEWFTGPDQFNITEAQFTNVIEMKNGKYLAVFVAGDFDWAHTGYMILNGNLEVEKMQLFNDSEIELEITDQIFRDEMYLFNAKDEDAVYILARYSGIIDPELFYSINNFYSVIKLSFSGEILEIIDFEQDPDFNRVFHQFLTPDEKLILMGSKFNSGPELFIQRVDLKSRSLELEKTFVPRNNLWDNIELITAPSGYILKTTDYTSIETEARIFSVFLDEQFNPVDSVFYDPETLESSCWVRDLIPNMEGGYYSLTFSCLSGYVIQKLDQSGTEIWRWAEERDNDDGRKQGYLINTSDGGVIYVGTKAFNNAGHKISWLKLDRNGNL